MKRPIWIAIVCLLAGCQSMGAAMQYEQKAHQVKMADDTYRVFEHPKRDRIMTTPSFGNIAARGTVEGATLGMANLATPEQRHEAAARKYLDETGRSHCPITRGHLLMDPQYEFYFTCGS